MGESSKHNKTGQIKKSGIRPALYEACL